MAKELTTNLSKDCGSAAPQQLLRGVMQFNRGDFFPCHETLEELWLDEARPIRRLYQGILQIAVALHHWRRGNYRGCLALLKGGCEKLEPLPPRCQQIDVAALRISATAFYDELQRLGAQGMHQLGTEELPRIKLLPLDGNSSGTNGND